MLEWAFRAFVQHWRMLLRVVFLLRAPVTVLGLAVGLGVVSSSGNLTGTTYVFDPSGRSTTSGWLLAAAALVGALDGLVLTPAFLAALNRAAVGVYLGLPPKSGEAIRYGFRRFGSILLITLLVLLTLAVAILPIAIVGALFARWSDDAMAGETGPALLILLSVVTVIAVILISVRLTFASLAFVADGRRGREALRRSRRMSTGHFWKIFGVVLLGLFLSGVVTFAITTVTSSIAPGRNFAAATLTTAGALAVQLVVAPFVTLLTAALYFAIRATSEPLDSARVLADVRGRDPA